MYLATSSCIDNYCHGKLDDRVMSPDLLIECLNFLDFVSFVLLVSAPMCLLAYIVLLVGHSLLKWTLSATKRMLLNYLSILRQSGHLDNLKLLCEERLNFMILVFLRFRPFLFLHITCLNTDLVTIYRHLLTTLLETSLKCQLVKPSAHPRQFWTAIFDHCRQVKSDQYSITNNRRDQSDLDSSSEHHARAKQFKTNVCKPVYSASVPSPFVLSSPRSYTSFPLRNSFATASTVNFL